MAWNDTDLSRAAALAGLVIVVSAFGSGAYTYGLLSDQESGTIAVTADFEPATTPEASGRNVAAEANCGEIVLVNEGPNAAQVSVDGPGGYETSQTVPPGNERTLDGLPEGDYDLTASTGKSSKEWTVNQESKATVTVACSSASSSSQRGTTTANETTTTTTATTTTETKTTTTETTTQTETPETTTADEATTSTATTTETTTATPTTTETTTATPTTTETTTENET